MIKIRKINRKSLSQQIYESIKNDILNGDIGYGDKLTNRDLQEQFNVSSTPVRDAINRLYQDGLIEKLTKTGAIVINFSTDRAVQINEMMREITLSAVNLCMKKSKNTELCIELEEAVLIQKGTLKLEQYLVGDSKFHKAFFIYSENPILLKTYEQLETLWILLTKTYYSNENHKASDNVKHHINIIDAIKLGEIEQIQNLISEHYDIAELFFMNKMEN